MPNGYGPAMRRFTKLLKPPFTILRKMGHESVIYVDDSFLQADSYEDCIDNARDTILLLQNLGFKIHLEKSILIPTQEITFLGFVINSVDMTIKITYEKVEKIEKQCEDTLQLANPTIRQIASLLGNIVAAMQAVPYGVMHYRCLEQCKIQALKQSKGNFDADMIISHEAKSEVQWWLRNIRNSFRSLLNIPVDYEIFTDASNEGWGATDKVFSIGGPWDKTEKNMHINALELLSVKFSLLSFTKLKMYKHIRINSDNTTTVAYINHKGGIKSQICNKIATEIWNWAQEYSIWLSAAHIPGVDNIETDKKSRIFSYSSEWMISDLDFNKITQIFGTPDIDMFATRLNRRVQKYVSWKPEPES